MEEKKRDNFLGGGPYSNGFRCGKNTAEMNDTEATAILLS
jgi:hypothetical protein